MLWIDAQDALLEIHHIGRSVFETAEVGMRCDEFCKCVRGEQNCLLHAVVDIDWTLGMVDELS